MVESLLRVACQTIWELLNWLLWQFGAEVLKISGDEENKLDLARQAVYRNLQKVLKGTSDDETWREKTTKDKIQEHEDTCDNLMCQLRVW